MIIREAYLAIRYERREVEEFLAQRSLTLETDVEFTVVAVEGERILGTGSLSGNVLKCIAVEEDREGRGLAQAIVARLVAAAEERGRRHLFVFTKPENEAIFAAQGFTAVERMPPDLVLLENERDGFGRYLSALRETSVKGRIIGSAVVNCNPFTLGHLHLVETSAAACDVLHLFVVEEDKSSFPTDVRFRLVREGTAHVRNVVLHSGGPYIISAATFPSYFLKQPGDAVDVHAKFDLLLFGKRIAPALGIGVRFVGEEPYCAVTRRYNEIMKSTLPAFGVRVEEIPRLGKAGRAISASEVRRLIGEGNLAGTEELVPETTYRFLRSAEAEPVIGRIKAAREARH